MSKNRNHDPERSTNSFAAFVIATHQRELAGRHKPDVVTVRESALEGVANTANKAGAWVKDQIHSGLQEFVSKVLIGHEQREPDKEKAEPEKDPGEELDR